MGNSNAFLSSLKNPLDDDNIIKLILTKFYTKDSNSMRPLHLYDKIQKCGTEEKKESKINNSERDKICVTLFNSYIRVLRAMKDEDLADISITRGEVNDNSLDSINSFDSIKKFLANHRNIAETSFVGELDSSWIYFCYETNREKNRFRFYFNFDNSDTYKFIQFYIHKCLKNNLDFQLKTLEYEEDSKERADSTVMYCNESNLNANLEILKEFMKKYPDVIERCGKPPILSSPILGGWTGFSQEIDKKITKGYSSYSSVRSNLLEKSIYKSIFDWIRTHHSEKVFKVGEEVISKYDEKAHLVEEKKPKLVNVKQLLFYKVMNSSEYSDKIDKICSIDDTMDKILSGEEINFFDFNNNLKFILRNLMSNKRYSSEMIGLVKKHIKQLAGRYNVDYHSFALNDNYVRDSKLQFGVEEK